MKTKPETVQMKIRIPVDLHNWLLQQAAKDDRSMNYALCALVAKAKEAMK